MFTRTAGIVAAGTQNRRVISVGYRMCYRTHRCVGYCIQISQGNLCGVPYRTHRSVGYCGATVTELTEV